MLRPVDTEAALRTVEAGADGRLIYTEARSGLDPTDAFDGAQDEHCTEHLGQTVDRLLEVAPPAEGVSPVSVSLVGACLGVPADLVTGTS